MSESEFYKKIGDNIKALRDYYKITQKQLGEVLNVRNTAISNYEKGNPIDLYNLNITADYFKVSISELLQDDIIEKMVTKMADEYKKYKGLYHVYYFDHQNSETIKDSLLELDLNPKGGYTNLKVAGVFNNIEYFGEFSLYDGYYIIELDNTYSTDSVFIQGLVPPPHLLKDSYGGGITFVLSISRGRSKLPRFQKLIISRKPLDNNKYINEFLNIEEFANIIKLNEDDDNRFQKFLHQLNQTPSP